VKFLELEEPSTVINELVVLTYERAKNQWLRISSLSFLEPWLQVKTGALILRNSLYVSQW
jgi:hypothetical protein